MVSSWVRLRRCAAGYLALFFVAVAAAPHHHINGLEDLLLDQPSDSGVVVESGGPVGTAGAPAWNTFWLVDDDACLACFNADFVAAPGPSVPAISGLELLTTTPAFPTSLSPARLPGRASSRAPPALA